MEPLQRRTVTLEYIEAQLRPLAMQADALGEPLLPYLIEQATLEARKPRERQQ